MRARETLNIAACASSAAELDALVRVARDAGEWGIVPVEWPDATALVNARQIANAYLLHTGTTAACDELVDLLSARPTDRPLIVIGKQPSERATPNLWMTTMPPPAMLGAILAQLFGAAPEPAPGTALAWRRKSDMIIGNSAPVRELLQSLDRLAPAQTPVLITGESGVGKELVARALHFCGPRAAHPFVAINCAAIPDNLFESELFGYQRGAFTGAVNAHAGAFEAAHKGTLFLDEIGEMPIGMQAKLLRVLETSEVQRIGATEAKPVNFRLVSATNRDLGQEVKHGRFREDLYYRVQVYPLHVAPLRDRPEDIPPIVTHHLSSIGTRENRPSLRLTPAALEKLVTYGWPGNVRELVNMLERAVVMARDSVIDAEHIIVTQVSARSQEVHASVSSYRDAKAKFELDYYSQLMRIAGGNVTLAAKLGHKTRREVYDALKRLGLDATAYRDPEE
jgi:two-component system response regulator GlrR